MGYYDWIHEFNERAYRDGDFERLQLGSYAVGAWELNDLVPDQALALLDQGKALAQQLNEPWWMLFYDHIRLQTLIWRKRDYAAALDLAVRSTVETRKPQYMQCPQRTAAQIDLISIYVGIDPAGYAEQIEKALSHMAGEADDFYTRCAVQEARADFAFEMGDMDMALTAALAYLSLAETGDSAHSRDHYRSNAHYRLCRVAYRRELWDDLLQWSEAGMEIAARIDNALHLVELTMWCALANRQRDDESSAVRLYRRATAITSRLGATPWSGYFDAWAGYHEAAGALETALLVRTEELKALEGKGQILTECRCRIHRCRLLKQMGQPLEEEVSAARSLAQKLRYPAAVLAQIEHIAGEGLVEE